MGWYFTILQEMREMGLKGNELIVFAVINGFSQNGNGAFHGNLAALQEMCGIASRQTITDILKSLVDKGLINKTEVTLNGVKNISYSVCPKIGQGVQKMDTDVQKLDKGCPKNGHIYNNDINISPTEINNNKRFDFKKSLIELGVSPEVADDWMQVRKAKRASNTETAFKRIKNEIDRSGLSANECITIAVARSWQGFQADWVANQQRSRSTGRMSVLDNNRMVAEELMRMANMEET